jgi:glucokinase
MHYTKLTQTLNPSFQHVINQSAVFHHLRRHGPTYRNQIATALNISLPSVTRTLNVLEERGFVELTDYRKTSQARTVPYYQITLGSSIMLSLDLLKGAIAAQDLNGLFSITYFKRDLSQPVVENLASIIQGYVDQTLEVDISQVKSICIGAPGIIDVNQGVVLQAIYHPELENVQLKAELEKRFDCIVFVDNVVNIAAFANYCEFNREITNIVSCDIGLEIGTGLFINGAVHRGAHFVAGETGFFFDNPDDHMHNYKRTHTFRSLCCDLALQQRGEVIDPASLEEDQCLEEVAHLFEVAVTGDPVALAVLRTYIDRIVLMINKVDILLNPQVIVIGGDICLMPHSKQLFLDQLNERYRPFGELKRDIVYSKYGPLVTLYGAGRMALEHYLQSQFPYMMGDET